jgi:hypothetical protein
MFETKWLPKMTYHLKTKLEKFLFSDVSGIQGQNAEIYVSAILKFNLAPVFLSKNLRLISSKNSEYQACCEVFQTPTVIFLPVLLPVKGRGLPHKINNVIAGAVRGHSCAGLEFDSHLVPVVVGQLYHVANSGPGLVQLAHVLQTQLVSLHQTQIRIVFGLQGKQERFKTGFETK